jgi:hypothetical protein
MSQPPEDLPAHRFLTGEDDAVFCRRVTESLAQGYKLSGSLAATVNGQDVIVAQAVTWPSLENEVLTPRAQPAPSASDD